MVASRDANPERAARLRRATGLLFRRIRSEAHGASGLTLSQESIVALLTDPLDRRRTILHATANGVAALNRSQELKQRWLEDALDGCAAEDLETLDDAMSVIERIIAR